ncbi:MAG TPA: Holliday junction branch migration protein RuvA [Actinomycetota bacterium]|nr:Holliday junction branch migration protein RuvA [Actinomycetota bacterium]
MIAFLDGALAAKGADGCFLEVNGVGYRVACSGTTLASLPEVGARVRLWTHMHVREDAMSLFGFATEAEQALFEALISVSGVGPKVALQMCSAFTPESFRRAVATDDVASLSSVPGVGKKTAQRIVLELKERLALPDLQVVGAAPAALAQARSALENLGYSPAEIRAALGEVDAAAADSVEEVVKSALRVLA